VNEHVHSRRILRSTCSLHARLHAGGRRRTVQRRRRVVLRRRSKCSLHVDRKIRLV